MINIINYKDIKNKLKYFSSNIDVNMYKNGYLDQNEVCVESLDVKTLNTSIEKQKNRLIKYYPNVTEIVYRMVNNRFNEKFIIFYFK
jgi:hypothetical protein